MRKFRKLNSEKPSLEEKRINRAPKKRDQKYYRRKIHPSPMFKTNHPLFL